MVRESPSMYILVHNKRLQRNVNFSAWSYISLLSNNLWFLFHNVQNSYSGTILQTLFLFYSQKNHATLKRFPLLNSTSPTQPQKRKTPNFIAPLLWHISFYLFYLFIYSPLGVIIIFIYLFIICEKHDLLIFIDFMLQDNKLLFEFGCWARENCYWEMVAWS